MSFKDEYNILFFNCQTVGQPVGLAVNLFLAAVKKTNVDTSHQTIMNDMSNVMLDAPAGHLLVRLTNSN